MGRMISRHYSSRANVLAGCILASLATVGGAILLAIVIRAIWIANFDLPWRARFGWSWEAVFWGVIADVLIFTIAAILWWVTHSFFCSVIAIHENGLSIDSAGGLCEIPWFKVAELVEVDVGERLPILHFPANLLLPRWHSKVYEIWLRGESEPRSFDKNTVSDLGTFGSHLVDACQRHSIPISQRVDLDL